MSCLRAEGTPGPKAGVSSPVEIDKKHPRPAGTPYGMTPDGERLWSASVSIGGMPDHVHLIIRDSKTVANVPIIKEPKGGSYKLWVKLTWNTYWIF